MAVRIKQIIYTTELRTAKCSSKHGGLSSGWELPESGTVSSFIRIGRPGTKEEKAFDKQRSPVYAGSSDEGAGGGGWRVAKALICSTCQFLWHTHSFQGQFLPTWRHLNVGLASDANNQLLQASSSTSPEAPLSTHAQVADGPHPTWENVLSPWLHIAQGSGAGLSTR